MTGIQSFYEEQEECQGARHRRTSSVGIELSVIGLDGSVWDSAVAARQEAGSDIADKERFWPRWYNPGEFPPEGAPVTETISNETRFLHAIEMGLGSWQFGDRVFWSFGQTHNESDIHAAFQTSLSEGIRFIDTAEVYGMGKSERFLGEMLKAAEQPALIATKFFPYPWRVHRSFMNRAIRNSLERLGLERVDLYQVHWPNPIIPPETIMDWMADLVKEGLVRTVGVSNFNPSQTVRAYTTLARKGIPLAANQVEYHLLDRRIEKNGLLARCRELGIRVIAYSPLAKGFLTGKYSAEKLPPGPRAMSAGGILSGIHPLLKLMTEIGQDHGGKSNAQVALNWCICKGTLPIPGAKNAEQARQNAGALGWKLTPEQVAALDTASDAATK
jgi:aryl-alcohol dehydrogenase-like predicted oxidoreductase